MPSPSFRAPVASAALGTELVTPSVTEIERFRPDASAKPSRAWRRLTVLGAAVVPAIALIATRIQIDNLTDVLLFALVIVLVPTLTLVAVADILRDLHRSIEDFYEIISESPVPTCVIDHDGTVLVWNSAAERTAGYASAEIVGRPAPIVPAEDPERVARLYDEALRGIPQSHVEVRLLHRDGHPIDVRVSTAPLHDKRGHIVALFEDVTSERARQAEIAFLADHDPLTGLPNRRQFERELESTTAATTTARPAHLALFDIDGFKLLNDSGGHTIGDRILRELSALLSEIVRAEDFLARLSGDEFALILNTLGSDEATTIVQHLLDVARDYRLCTGAATFDITLSAGLYTLAPGDSGEKALRRADESLYQAKALGKNRLERWTNSPDSAHAERRAWSPVIKDALRDLRLDIHLQPIVALQSGQIAFYEALCRLRSPDGTIFAAGDWIDHAEHLGLMPAIDSLMLQQAGDLLRDEPDLCVFVNISASSFHDRTVMNRLEEQLATVPYGSLGIEITEHTTLSNPDRTRERLEQLKRAGALIAIDDFGLGFTSFNELASLPCDIVKIPGSFAQPASSTVADGTAIAQAISHVAHHYGKSVIIEGVETAATARWARLLGIEYGQGWHFGYPAAAPIGRTAAAAC